MKYISDVLDMFKIFVKEIETQTNKRIKCFLSDRGIEYLSNIQ